MKLEWAPAYATRIAEPYVQEILYTLHRHFTCRPDWQRHGRHGAKLSILQAAPLPHGAHPPRPDEPIQIHAEAKVLFGEYTWHIFGVDYSPRRDTSRGLVHVRVGVSMEPGISRAYQKYMPGIARNGFLCEAEACVLQDNSRCYCIRTNTGLLWLRSAAQRIRRNLGMLCHEHTPTRSHGRHVIHVAETTYVEVEMDQGITVPGPWTHYKTHDESSREWTIEKSELHIGIGPKMVGRSDSRLQHELADTLEPPYEAIWQPDSQQDWGVPFMLMTD